MTVSERYLKLLSHIHDTAKQCGRDPAGIKLLAVTKGYSLDHILPAYQAGCRDFGENRVQEALGKMPEGPKNLQWHLIGTLQKKKVRKVVGKFHLIHSIDSQELAQKVSECSEEEGLVTSVLLQANISGEETKHGFAPGELIENIDQLIQMKGISVEGLMTMAPLIESEEKIRRCFSKLRELRDALQMLVGDKARFKELSMGMSHDYRIAIEEGATILRIGTAIFGVD